jgi:Rhs element Vgr protein
MTVSQSVNSPSINSTEVVNLTVYSNGSAIDNLINVHSVEVEKRVNSISRAKIVILDGDMPSMDFPVSAADTFKPGTAIKICAGYGKSEETVFEGLIVRHGISISGDNFSRLVVECRDKAVKMTIGRNNAAYVDSSDSDIIKKLIGNHGLSNDVTSTSETHKELVQYYSTDWDFMLSRAEANGHIVLVNNGKVTVKPPETAATPVLSVTYGTDLMEFHAEINAASQFKKVEGSSWDPATQKEIVSQTASPQGINLQGDLTSDVLADVVGPATYRLQTSAPTNAAVLGSWANGCQVKAELAKICGVMKFQGSAKADIGTSIELFGVGNRFNGKVFVSAVIHTIADGNWLTSAEFGLSPEWFADRRDLVAPPASGLLPGIEGLHSGVVTKLDGDPEVQNKIQVEIPVLGKGNLVWARFAQFYGSEQFGSFFVPEVGDEVILGYFNNDPSYPVILGSLYSSKRKPAYELTQNNFIKAIVTKSKLKLEFNDDKKTITITTPSNNKIVLSDDEKSILLQDQNNNKVLLDSSGITLDSPKDIKLTAKGKISLDAVSEIGVTAKADVKLSGLNINNSANVGFVAKGTATAELSASGQTTVKGAIVMIN